MPSWMGPTQIMCWWRPKPTEWLRTPWKLWRFLGSNAWAQHLVFPPGLARGVFLVHQQEWSKRPPRHARKEQWLRLHSCDSCTVKADRLVSVGQEVLLRRVVWVRLEWRGKVLLSFFPFISCFLEKFSGEEAISLAWEMMFTLVKNINNNR